MMSIIENNPYRILGTYSDSKLMDIIANANKIKAFAKVGRTIQFDIDGMTGILTTPERTIDSVDNALALLQSDSDKSKYSIFWFNKSGVDFGTADLIRGNFKTAGSKFISAIESNDITLIREIIGDKTQSISSSDLLNCYIDVMNENGCSEESIKGCLEASQSENNISIISALKNSGLSEELKKKTTSVSDICIDDPSASFLSLNKYISEVKQLIISTNLSNDLALSSAYDQFCKSVRSKVISISNRAFDNIGKTEKNDFITLLNSCLEVLKSIDTSLASAGTIAKYKEDIDTMSKNVKEVDETYLLAIASNEDICWHCGNKATRTKTHTYEKKVERRVGYNTKQVTTYSKTVTFHICDECAEEDSRQSIWSLIGMITTIVIEIVVAIWLAGNKKYFGWEYNWDWVWPLIFINLFGGFYITILLGSGIGWVARRLFASGKIRKYMREESDHPLVKRIKKEGFS